MVILNGKVIGNVKKILSASNINSLPYQNPLNLYCIKDENTYKGGKCLNLFDYICCGNYDAIDLTQNFMTTTSNGFAIIKSSDDAELYILSYEGNSLENGEILINNQYTLQVHTMTQEI